MKLINPQVDACLCDLLGCFFASGFLENGCHCIISAPLFLSYFFDQGNQTTLSWPSES